jgi:C_GCAxxG_C_C family probable redox protein
MLGEGASGARTNHRYRTGVFVSRVETASTYFLQGASCSQAVFATFAPSLGMDAADALRLAAGLGGGMHVGSACGAASGAVLVLGLLYGGDDSATERHAVMQAVEGFYERFVAEVGAVDCPSILGCDIRTPEGRATSREHGLRESRCLHAVTAATRILEDMMGERACE